MSPKTKTFFQRLFSTVVLLAVLGGALAWNNAYGYAALICLFCNMTTVEWYRMLRERADECCRWLVLGGGLVYPWVFAWGCFSRVCERGEGTFYPLPWEMADVAVGALLVYVLVAFVVMLHRMDRRGLAAPRALAGLGTTLLAFVYPVWMFAFALIFVKPGLELLLIVLLLTKLSDIWAYVCGVLLGRRFISRPFSPVVSPKKSWEGIIGSLLLTVLSAVPVCRLICGSGWAQALQLPQGAAAGTLALCTAVVFCAAVFGDLAGSLIKRGLGVKDSGSLLPGIGGIFDLIDSPAFTISLLYVVEMCLLSQLTLP